MLQRTRLAIRQLVESEQGIALPMAMLITVIALGLATVPILASVNTQKGDSRDRASDAALAAADAGMGIAVMRQTKAAGSTAAEACVYENASALYRKAAATATSGSEIAGWCPAVTLAKGSSLIPAETEVKYRVQPVTYTTASKVVNVIVEGKAWSGGAPVTRRIKVSASASGSSGGTAAPVFSYGQIVGIDSLKLGNDAKVYNGGAGSNGWVELSGSANVCGTVRYGTTFTTDTSTSKDPPPTSWPCTAGRTASQGIAEYPDFKLPGDITTNNSNSRLSGADPSSASNRGNLSWNASNKSLTVNYGTLTLGGTAPYYLCRLELAGGSSLLMASGAKIKIYFEAPQNCSGLNGGAQFKFANGATVYGDSASGPIFAFVGSSTPGASLIELQGGAEAQQFVIYASNTKINVGNDFKLTGAVVGRTLEFQGSAAVNKAKAFTPPNPSEFLPATPTTSTAFARSAYLECSAAGNTTEPAYGC